MVLPKDFIGRARKDRAALDPYSRFSGPGSCARAEGPNTAVPPGLLSTFTFTKIENIIIIIQLLSFFVFLLISNLF